MKHVVVMGSSIAGTKALELLRQQNPSWSLTLIAPEGYLPYKKDQLASVLAKEATANNILYQDKKFFESNNITLITDSVITRINLKKKKIHTEKKDQIDFDVLILADLPEYRFPEIKGVNKTGVWGINHLKDIIEITKAAGFIDAAVIQSDSWRGLQLASAIHKRKKEAILLLSTESMLVSALEPDVLTALISRLNEEGIKIIESNPIVEILGEGEVMAVRLQSGKVLACQSALIDNTKADIRIFSEPLLEFNQKASVGPQFETNCEGVYAVEDFAQSDADVEPSEASAEEEGKLVAAHIQGQTAVAQWPMIEKTLQLGSVQIDCLGTIQTSENRVELRRFDSINCVYQKIIVENNVLVGAILINCPDKKDQYRSWIVQKQLLESTFLGDFDHKEGQNLAPGSTIKFFDEKFKAHQES